MEENKKEAIKRAVAIFILILLIGIVGFIMIKYEIEGETNLPFKLSKIIIISTADAIEKDEQTMSITQCNDLYLTIEKNENYITESMIKKISIENIKIMSAPKKGKVNFYRPNNVEGVAYTYNDDLILDGKIIYYGDSQTSLKNLTISNQGGTISFRSCVQEIGEIAIDTESQEKEVGYSNKGTLLKDAQIKVADIKYNLGFDIFIELVDGKIYKGYVNITLPVENVESNGVNGVEMVDLENVVFKRTKIY